MWQQAKLCSLESLSLSVRRYRERNLGKIATKAVPCSCASLSPQQKALWTRPSCHLFRSKLTTQEGQPGPEQQQSHRHSCRREERHSVKSEILSYATCATGAQAHTIANIFAALRFVQANYLAQGWIDPLHMFGVSPGQWDMTNQFMK